jgi:hypothetical protein
LPAVVIYRLETALSVAVGEEVSYLKYFKITKTWAVKAESEAEAVKLVAANPAEYLDSETVTRTEYKGQREGT